ncbi:MAG: hypothetical protein ILA34_00605 [Bacteroidaceae bacterium]|nr:hypothetical protein [Bacteroidaceae bacterium]
MKKFLLVIGLVFGMGTVCEAQEIFNSMLEHNKKIAYDEKSNDVQAKVARFKYTALQYMRRKCFESEGDVTKKFMNDQAYYMDQFVMKFFESALLNTDLKPKEKKERIMLFIDASGSNPLFHDTDKELVNAYVENGKDFFTPFCLDTDWPKAYAAVMSKLEKK